MPNNFQEIPELSEPEIRQLRSELFQFKTTRLYHYYIGHFKTLARSTTEQILECPLKGLETLFTREAWIGEARTAELMKTFFDTLSQELDRELEAREQES